MTDLVLTELDAVGSRGTAVAEVLKHLGDDRLLTRREAAVAVRRSVPTLERWARLGLPPDPIYINGRPFYTARSMRALAGRDA